jgi:hypothetical protein
MALNVLTFRTAQGATKRRLMRNANDLLLKSIVGGRKKAEKLTAKERRSPATSSKLSCTDPAPQEEGGKYGHSSYSPNLGGLLQAG